MICLSKWANIAALMLCSWPLKVTLASGRKLALLKKYMYRYTLIKRKTWHMQKYKKYPVQYFQIYSTSLKLKNKYNNLVEFIVRLAGTCCLYLCYEGSGWKPKLLIYSCILLLCDKKKNYFLTAIKLSCERT